MTLSCIVLDYDLWKKCIGAAHFWLCQHVLSCSIGDMDVAGNWQPPQSLSDQPP